MSEFRLNLTALRRRFLYEHEPELVRVEDLLEQTPDALHFSRRQVLRSAGLAAAVLTPAIRSARGSLTPALRGPFEMRYKNDVVTFLLGKTVRWTIDPKAFSGPAKLTVDRTEEFLLIKLRDAFFPGTEIPADCTISIKPRLTECTMKFAMAFGGFRGETSFEKWLAGEAPLKSEITLDHTINFGDQASGLTFQGPARANFTPDWKLQLRGSEIARVLGFGEYVTADQAAIVLASNSTAPSAIDHSPGSSLRRTFLTLDRGIRSWSLDHGLDPEAHWTLSTQPDLFDRLTLEAIEHREKGDVHAIVAEQTTGSSGASFTAHAARSIDGSPFALPLTRARLAILFDRDRVERAFEARYHKEPVWLHANGCSLLVGAPKQKDKQTDEAEAIPTFELYARDGVLEHMHCEPALLKIAAPIAGAIVEPAEVREGTRLAFVQSHRELEAAPLDPFLAVYALSGTDDDPNPLRFPANFVIGVVRADDLLVLKFEFLNMTFTSEGKDGLRLIKQTGKDISASYLVVHFPMQNIYEEAFFSTGDPGFTPNSPTVKQDPPGSETPTMPPVHARAAGASRLAFYLPDAVTSLPYSLQGLLDWSKLEPSLVPVALPPPPPPLSIYFLSLGTYRQAALATGNVGSKYQVNGGKFNRSKMNLVTSGGNAPVIPPSTMTDVRTSPKFVPTTDMTQKQQMISEITKNTRASISSAQLELMAEAATQAFPGQKLKFPIGMILDMSIRQPHLFETALETPYRLIMSPNRYAGWAHSVTPVATTDKKNVVWTELWHTRLGIKRVDNESNVTIDEQDDYYRTLRAVWSPDYNKNDGPEPNSSPIHYDATLKNSSNAAFYFRASLDARDRHELVELMSDYTDFDDTVTRFVRADRLMLTSLGSWMNVRGAWKVPFNQKKPLSVEEWRHRGTMGRDHYVKVVYKGFLFPFGHAASLIKITERKFVWENRFKCNICYLRQRMFIVVRQPVKQYPAVFQRNGSRKLPFTSVEITTLITPDIAPPETDPLYKGFTPGQDAFWPHVPVGSELPAFKFHLIGIDWEGHRIEFTMPLGFVDNKRAYDFSQVPAPPAPKPTPSFLIDKAIQAYLADTVKPKVAFDGHKIAYAASKKSGDTTFETTSITFGAEVAEFNTQAAQLGKADQPGFYPTVESAELHIEAVKQIVGAAGASPMRYHRSFLEKEWDAAHNAGQVFLEVLGDPIGLAFGGSSPGASTTDKIGGLVSPSMAITGLSRLSGPLSGNLSMPDNLPLPDPSSLPNALKGAFDPKDFFGALDPDSIKLLGGLSLMDLLKLVTGASTGASDVKDAMESQLKDYANDAAKKLTAEILDSLPLPDCPIPSYITQMIYDVQNAADAATQGAQDVSNALKFPKQIQILFKWNPEVNSFGPFVVDGDPKKTLSLTALMLIPINPPKFPDPDPTKGLPDPSSFAPPSLGTPTYTVIAKLEKFTMDLFSVIAIKFNSVSFKMESGKKTDVNADVEDVSFEGPLAFVNDLEKIIPSDGFTDPPSLEITPTGVKIGYDLSLPTISVGAFSLDHVSLGAELSLPFTGDPLRFRFHFCTRENPFLLTIYCFGGGGFFGIELGLDGLELLEASFEFGASVALDFGIASGSVSIMAGIYFKLQKKSTGDECQITGYVRVNGNLDVCGIITVSIELYMAITYDSGPPKKCWGEATLTIKVSILFFSIGFSTTMRKEFVDPSLKFADLMSADHWAEYHMAFIDQFQVQQ